MDQIIDGLYIENGENLTRNELKSRLNQMEVDYDTNNQKKVYFVELYNQHVQSAAKRKKIEDRVKQDTEQYFEKKTKRSRDYYIQDIDKDTKTGFDKVPKVDMEERKQDTEREARKITTPTNLQKQKTGSETEMERLSKVKDFSLEKKSETLKSPVQTESTIKKVPTVVTSRISIPRIKEQPVPQEKDRTKVSGDSIPSKNIDFNTPKNFLNINNQENFSKDLPTTEINQKKPNENAKKLSTTSIAYTFGPRIIEKIIDTGKLSPNIMRSTVVVPNQRRISSNIDLPSNGISNQKKDANEYFNKEFHSVQKVVNLEDSAVNGGRQEKASDLKIIQPFPEEKTTENVMQTIPKEKSDMGKLIKVFVAGMVVAVSGAGIFYCIKNSPQLVPDFVFFHGNESTGGGAMISKPNDIPSSTAAEPFIIEKSYFPKFEEFLSIVASPFSKIYWAMTSPKEFFVSLVWEGLKWGGSYLFWNYIWNHLYYIIGVFVLKTVLYHVWKYFKDRRNTRNIFLHIKDRLRDMYDISSFENGLSEEEIIHDYAKEYNYSESEFRNKIFPWLKEMRKNDGMIKEYEGMVNGRIRLGWQWCGF